MATLLVKVATLLAIALPSYIFVRAHYCAAFKPSVIMIVALQSRQSSHQTRKTRGKLSILIMGQVLVVSARDRLGLLPSQALNPNL